MATTTPAARGDVPARPAVSPGSKRAAKVADRIVGDVMAMGWPVGELLGSETELLGRYRVSRAVFREAVRLVEHKQVARTRRGPGGGLVITEPTVDAVIDAVVLYLYRVEARLDELFEARIAEAVLAGESGLARRRMRKHLEAEADYLRRRRSTRQLMPSSVVVLSEPGNGKRAEAVARRITQVVVGDGMQPGQLVGTERELIEREGVSRAVLREAVRLLEHHQIARMRRGPGGGLFVFEPSASAVTEMVAIYLARRGMRLADLAELRTGVEVAIAGLAASRIDRDGAARLHEALEREAASPDDDQADVVNDVHVAVAGAAHSRVLELIALVLIRLSRLYEIERLAPKDSKHVRAEVLRAHEAIAAAVESGDHELARHRMRRHLDALAAVMR